MAAALSQLSACVTRILSLSGFPKELKTRDIQAAFSEWDGVNGGFKIKWINDTSLLIVFNDATVGMWLTSALSIVSVMPFCSHTYVHWFCSQAGLPPCPRIPPLYLHLAQLFGHCYH